MRSRSPSLRRSSPDALAPGDCVAGILLGVLFALLRLILETSLGLHDGRPGTLYAGFEHLGLRLAIWLALVSVPIGVALVARMGRRPRVARIAWGFALFQLPWIAWGA
jgi:hypothetical protein